jgi:hypothetical protein
MRPWRWRFSSWLILVWSAVAVAIFAGLVDDPGQASACVRTAASAYERAGCHVGAWLADLVIAGLIWLAVAGPVLLCRRRRAR